MATICEHLKINVVYMHMHISDPYSIFITEGTVLSNLRQIVHCTFAVQPFVSYKTYYSTATSLLTQGFAHSDAT